MLPAHNFSPPPPPRVAGSPVGVSDFSPSSSPAARRPRTKSLLREVRTGAECPRVAPTPTEGDRVRRGSRGLDAAADPRRIRADLDAAMRDLVGSRRGAAAAGRHQHRRRPAPRAADSTRRFLAAPRSGISSADRAAATRRRGRGSTPPRATPLNGDAAASTRSLRGLSRRRRGCRISAPPPPPQTATRRSAPAPC